MIAKRIFIIIASILAAFSLIWLVLRFSPYPELKQFQSRPHSVRYYDRYGVLLQITPVDDGLRREIPREIPQSVKDVFVFSEDRRFYSHWGVDGISIIRALFQNLSRQRRVSGASTITMQLARIIANDARGSYLPPGQQNFGQKIQEAINAMRLETRFSKDEILEMYLLSLPFGFGAEGAASAARNFFATEISALSPAQIFCLAVIPRRPSFYNPFDNPAACMAAASDLQTRFAKNKKLSKKYPLLARIDESEFQFALSSARRFWYPFETPHLIRLINSRRLSGNYVKSGYDGEHHLSIDLALQHYIENAIAGNVAIFYSSRLTNGSAIVIDNESAEILAWVGSADFFNEDAAGQIDGVLALNQPGSSMKPFLYAMALEKGFKPSDVIADIPMSFGETEIYIPRNFNNRFNGPMLFRSSLASSLNIPAVYLLYRLGVRNYTQQLLELGFDSIEQSAQEAGLGLALGNAPVSLLELVRAFSVFPRDGIYKELKFENSELSNNDREQSNLRFGAKIGTEAKVHQKEVPEELRIYSADTARILCSFLSDPNARVTAFGAGRNFRTAYPSIFKTGTANQYQDIVALGASSRFTVGVWMGNFTGETVLDKTGSSVPAAIARNTLNTLHSVRSNTAHDFIMPENWRLRRICAVSGMDPTESCLSVINEFIHYQETRKRCTWHININGISETIYPAEYQLWFTSSVRQGYIDYSSRSLEIINPRDNFVYLSGSLQANMHEIPVEVIGGESAVLHVTHNGNSFTVSRPFVFFVQRITGVNVLHVKNGGEEQSITFTVE